MKNSILFILLCLLITGQQQATMGRGFGPRDYYLSYSPYVTRGYLGSRPEVRPITSPSPYIMSRKRSRRVINSLRRKYI